MSEMSIFSIVMAIGDLGKHVIDSILEEKDEGEHEVEKYLATNEREIALRDLYTKNLARLEDKYLMKAAGNDPILSHDPENIHRLHAAHVLSLAESMSQVEPMALVAKNRYGDQLEKTHSLLTEMECRLRNTACNSDVIHKLAVHCEPRLRRIATETHALLADTEDMIAIKTIAEAVDGLGYNARTAGKEMMGSKGRISVRARAEGGRIVLDTTSFPGISCHGEVLKIEALLEREGFILKRAYEDSMKPRNGKVKLNDPLPLFVHAGHERDSVRHAHSSKGRKTSRDIHQCLTSKNLKLLLQDRMSKTNQNLVREKTR